MFSAYIYIMYFDLFYKHQNQWFTKYNKSLATYMRTVGLDLTQVNGFYLHSI